MTRVSEDGDADKKKNVKPPAQTNPPTQSGDKSLILPELTIKDPIVGLEDTFASGLGSGPKSMASSRNRNKGNYQTTVHKRAVSNAASTKNGAISSRYRQGMIPTDNLKFN